ncbi:hypothetical protein G7Y89_g12016 [Cudoniella acicularis]|uniref:Blue (type 1) copper domain-containing protein n=1 Tax=Cudoniella acicularis TaxID=354080 RepID=A0A8H4VXC1_9HELO|nr:hypothetical protein G7Y89_g12016 [Cudoniella acicularis]
MSAMSDPTWLIDFALVIPAEDDIFGINLSLERQDSASMISERIVMKWQTSQAQRHRSASGTKSKPMLAVAQVLLPTQRQSHQCLNRLPPPMDDLMALGFLATENETAAALPDESTSLAAENVAAHKLGGPDVAYQKLQPRGSYNNWLSKQLLFQKSCTAKDYEDLQPGNVEEVKNLLTGTPISGIPSPVAPASVTNFKMIYKGESNLIFTIIMKFSSIASLGAVFGLASANHIQDVQVVCTDPAPTTVYQTVTVTAGGAGLPGNNNAYSSAPTPYVTTAGATVTSVDYNGSQTSVWVYPTGTGSKDCTVAIYEQNTVTVIIVNISVTVINGATTTITSTVSGATASTTPALPPTSSASVTTTSSATGAGTTHHVIVGADGLLKYRDEQLNAAIGDVIFFDFNSTNHTVTQSSFDKPCEPLAGGFNTHFDHFNPTNHTGVSNATFQVNVSTPLWFYCAQTVKVSHCHKGMVLGVNPAGKFDAFLSMATATATASGTGVVYTSVGPSGTAPASNTIVNHKATGTGGVAWGTGSAKHSPIAYKGRRAASFSA